MAGETDREAAKQHPGQRCHGSDHADGKDGVIIWIFGKDLIAEKIQKGKCQGGAHHDQRRLSDQPAAELVPRDLLLLHTCPSVMSAR